MSEADTCGKVVSFQALLGRDRVPTALAYVDSNPLRAGMAGRAEAYRWACALAHSSGSDEAGLLEWGALRKLRGWGNLREQSEAPPAVETVERLRLSTRTGAPFGSKQFVAELGRKFGRNLEPRKRGGQPKRMSSAAGVG